MGVLRNDFIVTYSSKMLLRVIMTRNYIFLIIINTLLFQALFQFVALPDPQLARI